jgi:hypothetical protein
MKSVTWTRTLDCGQVRIVIFKLLEEGNSAWKADITR